MVVMRKGSRLRLSEAVEGRVYRIVGIEGVDVVRRRILDMGLLPGLKIRVIRRAPPGTPWRWRPRAIQ